MINSSVGTNYLIMKFLRFQVYKDDILEWTPLDRYHQYIILVQVSRSKCPVINKIQMNPDSSSRARVGRNPKTNLVCARVWHTKENRAGTTRTIISLAMKNRRAPARGYEVIDRLKRGARDSGYRYVVLHETERRVSLCLSNKLASRARARRTGFFGVRGLCM